MPSSSNVVVIIGTGNMGLATARRLSSGRQLLLADKSPTQLQSVAETLRQEGHSVSIYEVDITNRSSIHQLAQSAAQLGGHIDAIVQTAGISPTTGSTQLIYDVDLIGAANVIAEFLPVAGRGTSMVTIASMAAQLPNVPVLSKELEKHLATAESFMLLSHPDFPDIATTHPGVAYGIAKRANVLRVQGACGEWGKKGARINSVSPGVISTAMGRAEMEGEHGETIRGMIAGSAAGRIGNSEEVAAAVAFLVGGESSFVMGTDLLVDGGVVPSLRWR